MAQILRVDVFPRGRKGYEWGGRGSSYNWLILGDKGGGRGGGRGGPREYLYNRKDEHVVIGNNCRKNVFI